MYNFGAQMAYAIRTGRCPVCHKRKRAHWQDGSGQRVTCGDPICYRKWLPGGKQPLDNSEISDTLSLPGEELLEGSDR